MVFGFKPNVSHLKPWGCIAHVLSSNPHIGKLQSRSSLGILVGYGDTQKGYRIYSPAKRSVQIHRNVDIWEDGIKSAAGEEILRGEEEKFS